MKPTYTSNEQREKGVEDFPEIIICPEPTFDINALTSRGYEGDYFQYFVGSPEFGWAGNKSEDVRKVFMEVSLCISSEHFLVRFSLKKYM